MPYKYNLERQRRSRHIRNERLKAARAKGTHTKEEWEEMKVFFKNTCVRCFGESGLINIEKDHIIPLYLGGSDAIENLQPLCALCNIQKVHNTTDYRWIFSIEYNIDLPEKYKLKFNG